MSNQLQTLKQSNPNGIVSAPQGSIFTRSGDRFFLVTNGTRKDLNVTKKSFAAEYKNEIWYPTLTNDSIAFATTGETWLKVDGNGKTGWAKTTSKTSIAKKTVLPSLGSVIGIWASQETSYFLKRNGELWGMGASYSGQLGLGEYKDTNTASLLLSDIKMAAANCEGYFAAALKNDGTIWFTGENYDGQFGNGDTGDSTSWVQTELAGDITASGAITDISVGYDFTMLLTEDGKAWMATDDLPGISSYTFIQVAEDVKSINCGGYNAFYIKNDNTLWGFGYNWDYELGDGIAAEYTYDNPYQIDSDVKSVVGGAFQTAYIKNDSTLWMMGFSQYGELGIGENPPEFTPSPIQVATNVKNVACGEYFTLYVTNDGELYGSGYTGDGELGLGEEITNSQFVYSFTLIDTNVAYAYCGGYHSLFVKNDRFLYGMGGNWYYQATGTFTNYQEIYYTPETGWTQNGITGLDQANYLNIQYVNGMYFAIGATQDYPYTSVIYYSTDAKTWNKASLDIVGLGWISKVAYGNGVYVAVNYEPNYFPAQTKSIYYSTDGISWTSATTGYDTTPLKSVAYGDGKFVAVGELQAALVSTDGINWSLSESNHALMYGILDIAYGNGVFSTAFGSRYFFQKTYNSYTQSFSGNTADNITPYGLIKDGRFYTTDSTFFQDYTRFYFETSSMVSGNDIVDVGVGMSRLTFFVLKTNGNLYRINSSTLESTVIDTNVSRSFFNGASALYIKNDNTLWGFGTNYTETFGSASIYGYYTTQSYHIDDNVIEASLVDFFGMVYYIKSDGTLYGYGENYHGNLGTGDNENRTSPVQIDTNVKYCEAMGSWWDQQYALYIKNDDTLWGMGGNYFGNLGIGNNNSTNVPTFITSSVAKILKTTQNSSTTIIGLDGNLYSAGRNNSGRLGIGYSSGWDPQTQTDVPHPNSFVKVPNISNANDGRVGQILTNDGKVYVCGYDYYGVLGLGYKTNTNIYSTNGTTWHTSSITNISANTVIFADNKFVMTTTNDGYYTKAAGKLVYSSTDAINWTSSYMDYSRNYVNPISSVYDGSKFIVTTIKAQTPYSLGYTYSSADAITWNTQSNWPDFSNYYGRIATDGTKYVLIEQYAEDLIMNPKLAVKQQ